MAVRGKGCMNKVKHQGRGVNESIAEAAGDKEGRVLPLQ